MKKIVGVFLYPIAWINLLSIRLRRKMFQLGRWKSVEFEVPTLSIIHESNTIDFNTMNWLGQILCKHDQKAYSFIHLMEFDTESLELEVYKDCSYLMKVKRDQQMGLDLYDTHYSKILGMSEAYVQFEGLKTFMIYESKFHTEIRSDIKIVILETRNDYTNSFIWPLGYRKHDMADMRQADFIIISDDYFSANEAWDSFFDSFDSSSCIFVLNPKDKSGKVDLEVVEYLSEQIDIIMDHDTFERLLIQKVEEVSRKKQCDIEN